MKKYRVSLAVLKPANFEIEIEADSEEEAIKLAIADLEEGGGNGEIEEYEDDVINDYSEDSGIYCEEIE